nr:flagellar basal-body MS-ring/collar protein FliF [Nereida sp. MMG025]
MQQITSVWTTLSMAKRAVIIGGAIAVFLAVASIGKLAATPTMQVLYSGLDAKTSGDILAALEARNVVFEVRGNAIYVEAGRRDSLRMDLATEGLPRNSATGYELLDGLSGFGTTSQMFDAAYWRAKEGELTRTIVSSPFVRNARVHIANQSSSPFARARDSSASVTLSTTSGMLPANQARAIQFLVASAVTGLNPQDVAVIDDQFGLIDTDGSASGLPASQAGASEDMRKRVERLLEARVGRGNVMVEASVELVTDRETIRETTIDPNSRVAISTTVEERTNSENGSTGQVTVASNLPDGDAASGERQSNGSQTREQTNFEVSEVQRELERSPGSVKRLTVAVLINGTNEIGEDGATQFIPRSDQELEDLRELVASAVGFSQERGDTITLKSLEFQPLPTLPEPVEASLFDLSNIDAMALIRLGALLAVVLFVALFIVRPVLKPARANDAAALPSPTNDNAPNPSGNEANAAEEPLALDAPDPVERLRQMIDERHDETVEVLRKWIAEPEGQSR